MSKIIKVENLSKAYQLGDFGTGTISRDLERFIAKLRGKEDPYLKVGETNDRTNKGDSDIVWSLKDINFDVEQGDAVGIIGRNGAGKSTLLKILSRVTSPTTGTIKVKGKIASLLEVGTGFHPELTGRENIYLNGAILGMRKSEIKRKFDEIVDFAGIQRYIDTPVKRYSSGMYVRLAFAVAAHLESEILIVDEVLAVGDAEFQKKCLGKMGDISKGDGRTILFVSHNMGMINQLCNKALLLNNGQLLHYDNSDVIVNKYLSISSLNLNNNYEYELLPKIRIGQFTRITVLNSAGEISDTFSYLEPISFSFEIYIKEYTPGLQIGIGLHDKFQSRVSTIVKEISYVPNGSYFKGTATLPIGVIAPNYYSFVFALWNKNSDVYDLKENICSIQIIDVGSELALYEANDYGSVILQSSWSW